MIENMLKLLKRAYWALLIGLVLGIPIGWFVRPGPQYEYRTYSSGPIYRIDNRAGTIERYYWDKESKSFKWTMLDELRKTEEAKNRDRDTLVKKLGYDPFSSDPYRSWGITPPKKLNHVGGAR